MFPMVPLQSVKVLQVLLKFFSKVLAFFVAVRYNLNKYSRTVVRNVCSRMYDCSMNYVN